MAVQACEFKIRYEVIFMRVFCVKQAYLNIMFVDVRK